jgi:hypothetical protein
MAQWPFRTAGINASPPTAPALAKVACAPHNGASAQRTHTCHSGTPSAFVMSARSSVAPAVGSTPWIASDPEFTNGLSVNKDGHYRASIVGSSVWNWGGSRWRTGNFTLALGKRPKAALIYRPVN